MRKMTGKQVVMALVTLFIVIMIFTNSAQPAEISSEASTGLLNRILAFLAAIGIDTALTEHKLRKCAHFVEFFMLGCLLIATTRAFTPYMFKHVFISLFIGLFVPVIDETIQIFMPGRSAQVNDILLDFSGVISGFFITFLFIYWLAYRKRKQAK